ncbi:testis-expressed protein 15 [Orycteropus afer afer]|uniref:Testis-expressed protein 15 n=1 Tax=Orycteropus afer afer TaxID=1230840 RepID=A0A8B6ZYX2_ORYAF|nr:testis-expressed protein 15 [Orycteropus afer afer]
MEMKQIAKHKTLWKMSSTSEPLSIAGTEANPLKKFTIPKIRRTAGKVYLSTCCTNTREYSFIHDTLNQCRLDINCDLQSSWQFGDTKLVHNEDLEKNFTVKRSEMRESGRHGRELEEHFCFLALPQQDVVNIYQNGISTNTSTLKILGNPLLGIYTFRHVDVALNYAHSRNITVESIIIFKVLFGRVKKIQPSVDKNKVSLDPSPNFDCHMSRNTPSLKDSIELQAYSSAVYFYEYNILSKPVDKPRQCLPYAIVTVKFIGQKIDNGYLMTSLRSLSTGFLKRAERTCSLNNCTVAKRIGKGKDATVIFEHFRKPIEPFVQENCSCNALNSEINPSNSSSSNSFGNGQNGNISILETHNGQTEHLAESSNTSQVYAQDSGLLFMSDDTRESVNGDLLLNLTYLKNILSGIASPLYSNIGSSTVTTSKLIKDPRLMRREESMGKQNNKTGVNEILAFEKSLDSVNSEVNLSSVSTNSVSSSEIIPDDHVILPNCLDAHCFKIPFDDSQSQVHNMCYGDYDYIMPNKITMARQCKGQGNITFPISLSKILSEVDNQNYSDEKVHRSQQRINTPLLIKQNSKPHNFYEPVNTCTKDYRSHISQETQSSGFQTVCQTDHQMSTVSPFQKKESIDDCIQNIGNMRNLNIDPEDNSKHREEQNFWKEIDHCFTNETKASLIDNCISLHQEHNKGESLDSSGKKHDQILLSQELELSVSSISTTKDKYELDSLAKEVQSNLTPTVGSFLQNHPQHSLEYKNNNIHTSFVISQKQMELTGEKTNQNCVSIMTDAFQEAKDISQVEEQLIDTVISSHGIETAHNNFNCNIAKENICVPRKNENELVLLEDNHKDFKDTPHIEDKSQDHPFFFDTQLNNDILLNIDFKEQNDNENDNQHETKEEDISSSVEDSLENIHGNEQQVFHTIKNFTDTDERRENKNCSNVELLISENFSTTFNMSWEENYLSTETTLIESEDIVTALKQNDPQNSGRSLQHLASTVLPEVPGSTVCASSNPEVQITRTSFPALSTNHEDHQKYLFKETCFSESPDFDLLVKHRISDCGVDMDINTSPDSFYQSVINENLVIQNLELENEIEVVTEECDDAFVFQQDTYSHGNVLREELEASYEALKARINWEALFGSSNWETEALESTKRKVNTDQHSSEEHNYFYSSTQNTKAELLNPVLLPDLQITITNDFSPGFSPTPDSHVFKDNFYKCLTEAEETEINKGEKVLGLGIYPQSSGENSYYPCGDKSDNITQESGLVSKSATSLSFDVSHNTHINHMSGKENNKSLFTGSSNVTTVNNESSCAFAKLHTDYNDTRSKKHMESRVSKRKLHSSFSDQNISHKDKRRHEMYEKKRRLTGQDSYECFLSLSQGRFKIFSKSEKHIKSVLDILNSEASLCKSKRLSRKLDKAVLHLKKAHRRVHTSLQLIAKVGEKKKGPLPKSYAIICNNFWESCDLEGYSSVYEGKYYSTKHFFSKRRDNKESERRALEYDGKSLTHVSKHKSYKRNGERTTETLSKRNIASSVSRSHTTIHMKEFCDQEQHPETQLCLASTSQSTSQSAYNKGSMNLPESSELQPLSGKTRCLFSPDHPNEKLPEKENQIDKNVLSNIGKYEKFETRSTHSNTKDVAKEIHSMANEVINKSNSVSLSCMKESVNVNTNKKYDASHIAHTEVKADILISVLEPSARYILNVDTYKPDNILSDCKRNLEINFSIEKCPTPVEHSQPNIFTRNFSVDPLNLTLMTSKKYKQFSAAPVTDSEGHAWKSYLDKQRIFAVDSFATFTLISHQQECGGRELLKREQCSSSNCSPIDGNDTNVTENSNLNLASVTEEKSYGKTTSKKLFSNDSYLLLADNVKVSFLQQCVAKKKVQDRKTWKVKRAEKAKDSIGDICHQKSRTEESSSKTGYKNRKKILEEESSYLSGKTMKHNLIESHVSTANATYSKALPVNNTVPNPLNKKKKERKVNSYSQSDSIVHCEITCNFKPGIIGIDHPPISHVHPENSKITTFQKKPMLYMNGLKEKHDSAHHTALITKLSQILQRADEASSLHILQEESKICQNILPSFVEAFERNQECSLEQILISRELLVQQNLWDNCKNKLKPCAVDSLVELQMMMETIQFVENKKRLLRDEPTFRSLLWYDETLYSELLGGPRGYQQQSNFYPAFQGRLKYNAFCELQKYHDQLTELLEETKRGKNSYYAFLKYKRQIKECEAIMKHCSDCFDFFLSVPFTCGVNFGDNLGDLETIRKSTLELISVYGNSAKVHSYPGKQDHMWIIIEIISSKVNFIKSNEARSIKISLYGLEHIFFDAAKNLVWEERKQSLNKKYTRKKYKEMLLKINQDAFSKLQEIYDTLSEGLSREQISGIGLEKETMIACRKSDNLINKTTIRFNSTLLSHPDICCISEILDQAKLADFKELQELSLRCTNHLEILKKYFQMLQEDNIDNIFITEENALDMVKNQNRGAVILKPEAIETYIEIVMILETMHFLKNSMAKKLDRQRFRGMLWFDSSLLPELVHCQEKMACFSFLKDESTDCLWKVIETAISELKKDMDIIYKYKEAVNCSYALHLLSRELEELSEIKTLLKKSECSISVYIDFVPYIASVNYGSTVTELEYNYNQFSTLLQNTRAAPWKDLGKMAHIMRVMKTIEHMKIICTKNAKLTISFILRQMLYNRKKTLQLKTEGKMNIQVIKHEKSINESSTCMKVPSIPECISNSSVKRPIIIDLRENAQEQEKNITPSVSKKQKVDMKDVTKINKEKAAFRNSRTTRPHPHNENKVGPSSSHNLKRNHLSPKKTEILRSPPGSLSPLRDLKDTCTSHSKSKVDLTDVSSDISEDFTRQQRNFNSVKKNVNFSAAGKTSDKKDCAFFAVCDQNSVNSTFSKDNETPSQKFLNISPDLTQKSCPSNIEPETNASFLSNTSVLSKPAFHSMRDTHTDLELNDPVLELQDNEILNSPIKNSTNSTSSSEPMFIQNKIPAPQVNETQPEKIESEENYMKDTLNPGTIPNGASGSIILNVNQTAEYSLSEQQSSENSKALTQNAAMCWNELPQSAYAPIYSSSEHSFGTSYPYYAWFVYHYSSINVNSITETYQGITSYEAQPLPSGMLTTVASTIHNTHSDLFHSQYFGYFAEEPQANDFVPVNGYFQSQMPISYNFQQPIYPQSASHQTLPQAADLYPPNPDMLPEAPWTYAPWQQESFHPGH